MTADGGDSVDSDESVGDDLAANDGERFDRLPATPAERTVEGRVSRQEVLEYYDDRFGIPPESFVDYTFWEKGAGKIWVYAGDAPSPIAVESLGMLCLRTRQEHWKPTTDFVQRFGDRATECVIDLDEDAAARFVAGEDQELDWDGDWGYLIAAHEIGVGPEGRPGGDGDCEARSASGRSSGQRGGETASDETGAERGSASSRTGKARETTAEPSRGPRGEAVERRTREPLGIGLYVYGELRSLIPKGRRRDL